MGLVRSGSVGASFGAGGINGATGENHGIQCGLGMIGPPFGSGAMGLDKVEVGRGAEDVHKDAEGVAAKGSSGRVATVGESE